MRPDPAFGEGRNRPREGRFSSSKPHRAVPRAAKGIGGKTSQFSYKSHKSHTPIKVIQKRASPAGLCGSESHILGVCILFLTMSTFMVICRNMKTPYTNSDPLDFTPVPRGNERHGGWTAEAQRAFIDALADCASVNGAAQRVGKTASTAYRLRAAAGAASFAAAWDAARQMGISQLEDVAMDRAIKGVEVPVFHKGERVGERRWFDNRLLMSMLRHNRSRRYGPKFAEFDLGPVEIQDSQMV